MYVTCVVLISGRRGIEAQLAARDNGIIPVEAVVAHRPPLATVIHFEAAAVGARAVDQSQVAFDISYVLRRRRRRMGSKGFSGRTQREAPICTHETSNARHQQQPGRAS